MPNILKQIWIRLLSFLGVLGRALRISQLSFSTSAEISPYPLIVRKLLDAGSPNNPLAESRSIPEIEICIPSTFKDLNLVRQVIESAIITSKNPVASLRIIVPDSQVGIFKELLGDQFAKFRLSVLGENGLLGDLIEICKIVAPSSRQGWLIQQVVKFMCVLTSKYDGVLILDSDTVLTSPRTWVTTDRTQILMISEEYHSPYQKHYLKFQDASIEQSARNPRVSFVTHHQLMQPHYLKEMFGGRCNWRTGLENWINTVSFEGDSPACEYHCYGTFMITTNPKQVRFARWGNTAVARTDSRLLDLSLDSKTLQTRFPSSLSISMHAYLS